MRATVRNTVRLSRNLRTQLPTKSNGHPCFIIWRATRCDGLNIIQPSRLLGQSPYWRFSTLSDLVAELLKRDSERARASSANHVYREWADRLLREIEQNLSSIPEDDGDRATVLWAAGLSMVSAGKIEWAESLASCKEYCPENTDVLLQSATARVARGQAHQAIQLARAVAELAG